VRSLTRNQRNQVVQSLTESTDGRNRSSHSCTFLVRSCDLGLAARATGRRGDHLCGFHLWFLIAIAATLVAVWAAFEMLKFFLLGFFVALGAKKALQPRAPRLAASLASSLVNSVDVVFKRCPYRVRTYANFVSRLARVASNTALPSQHDRRCRSGPRPYRGGRIEALTRRIRRFTVKLFGRRAGVPRQ
jgi:hypothetical protein